MKSMWPPLVAIFFMTYFHRARGGHGPLGPPWIRYCWRNTYNSCCRQTRHCVNVGTDWRCFLAWKLCNPSFYWGESSLVSACLYFPKSAHQLSNGWDVAAHPVQAVTPHTQFTILFFYRPPTKLRKGNDFIRGCPSGPACPDMLKLGQLAPHYTTPSGHV